MTEEKVKKPKKKQSAYKTVTHNGNCSQASSAYDDLVALGEECREVVDNAGENLANTGRIQTLGETADVIENLTEVTVPDCADSIDMTYYESVPTRKGRQASRATRRDNACAILNAAADAAEDALENSREHWEAWAEFESLTDEEQKERRDEGTAPEEPVVKEDEEDDVTTFANDCRDMVNEVEGCEFPGMHG